MLFTTETKSITEHVYVGIIYTENDLNAQVVVFACFSPPALIKQYGCALTGKRGKYGAKQVHLGPCPREITHQISH